MVQPVLLLSLAAVVKLHWCLPPVTTGVIGAEELLLGCLTCSLVRSRVLAPVHQLGTTGASGATRLAGTSTATCSGARAPVHPMPTG